VRNGSKVQLDMLVMPKNSDVRIRWAGPQKVFTILTQAFSDLSFVPVQQAQYGFDWFCYARNINLAEFQRLQAFQQHLKEVIVIDDNLDECFALDYHSLNGARTSMGSLVYAAKPYSHTLTDEHVKASKELAQHYIAFIQRHPLYRQAPYIVSVPPSTLDKPFDLPSELVYAICLSTGKKMFDAGLRKIRPTREMKDCQTDQEKVMNISGAFIADGDSFNVGDVIIILDDIYMSGHTLNEVTRMLRPKGAPMVLGLVATKTQN